ncbi:MAG: glutamate 5-kinase [Clostridia bacterium]|nr:glutamate 5-kinase [Clostridia bacterium]
MSSFTNCKRLVVKVGTSTLTHQSGHLNLRRVDELVKVLSDLKNAGIEILLVSSGAVGVGVGELGLRERPKDLGGKQAAAAVGQCALMYMYDKEFAEYGHVTAQVLLTRDGVEDPVRRQNIINTLDYLLQYNALPIINENDTVATEEIEFGDNDTLSAMVAVLAKADGLILLTDIDGLYTADPHKDPDATRIDRVTAIDEPLLALAGGAGTSRGTGGMLTKLHAAQIAMEANIPTIVMDGHDPKRLYDVVEGKPCGTLFERDEREDDA